MSGVFISVQRSVIAPAVIIQYLRELLTPEMELISDYDPL